jgi:hypothetical protein
MGAVLSCAFVQRVRVERKGRGVAPTVRVKEESCRRKQRRQGPSSERVRLFLREAIVRRRGRKMRKQCLKLS